MAELACLPIVLRALVWRADGRAVIDGLTATIDSPGITAIVGPNGAGKSVMLRLIDQLVVPDAGSVAFGARDADTVRRAFVFQRPGLLRASVAANVAVALAARRLPRAETHARVQAALARVGLADRAGDPARKLSAGEAQRLAMARAWAIEPELLLLDEPTANLDPGATAAIEQLILDLARRPGTKVLLVSHNLGQVARLAQDVLVLHAGRAVEHGPAREVLANPRSLAARAYLERELPWTSAPRAAAARQASG